MIMRGGRSPLGFKLRSPLGVRGCCCGEIPVTICGGCDFPTYIKVALSGFGNTTGPEECPGPYDMSGINGDHVLAFLGDFSGACYFRKLIGAYPDSAYGYVLITYVHTGAGTPYWIGEARWYLEIDPACCYSGYISLLSYMKQSTVDSCEYIGVTVPVNPSWGDVSDSCNNRDQTNPSIYIIGGVPEP